MRRDPTTKTRGLVQPQLQNDSVLLQVALDKSLAFFGHVFPHGPWAGGDAEREAVGPCSSFGTWTLSPEQTRRVSSQPAGRLGNKGVAKGLREVGTGMRVHRQNRGTTLRSKTGGHLDFFKGLVAKVTLEAEPSAEA